jgi:hypothetical protein
MCAFSLLVTQSTLSGFCCTLAAADMIWFILLISLLQPISSIPIQDCGYHLDGVDDALSFSLVNNYHPRFTLMFWFQNRWKDKNSHIPQTIYSQGLDPSLSHLRSSNDHTMRIIWSPESKLLIELKPYGILCHLEMTLQYERFYHLALSGGHNASMKVFVNGIDVNPICFKDVSLTLPPSLPPLFLPHRAPGWSGDRKPCRGRQALEIEDR